MPTAISSSACWRMQNGLIQQAQLVAAFHAWTGDKARPLADHLVALGHLNAAPAIGRRGYGGPARRGPRRRRREEPGRRPRRPLDPREPGRTRRPGNRGDLGHVGRPLDRAPRTRGDRTASYAVGTATSDGQRFRVLRPHARGGLGAVFVALRRRAQPRGRAEADPRPPRRRPDQPRPVPARGRDHRRAGAPRHRPGLRPGHLCRRPALLRDAVHQGRQPQGGDRPVPCRRGARRPTPAAGRWNCAGCCGGSSTSATRSTTRTAAGCCTATSSRATSSSASTARRWWSTGGWPRPIGRAEPGERRRRADAGPLLGERQCRDAARQCAGDAGVHEPRAGRAATWSTWARGRTSTAWARRSTAS